MREKETTTGKINKNTKTKQKYK